MVEIMEVTSIWVLMGVLCLLAFLTPYLVAYQVRYDRMESVWMCKAGRWHVIPSLAMTFSTEIDGERELGIEILWLFRWCSVSWVFSYEVVSARRQSTDLEAAARQGFISIDVNDEKLKEQLQKASEETNCTCTCWPNVAVCGMCDLGAQDGETWIPFMSREKKGGDDD